MPEDTPAEENFSVKSAPHVARTLLVSASPGEVRVALLHGDDAIEVHHIRGGAFESGDIILAKLGSAVPGADAWFVDLGLGRHGILNKDDVGSHMPSQGGDVLVQVLQTGRGTKGPKVTSKVSISVPVAAYSPFEPGVAVSNRIKDVRERRRLQAIGESLLHDGEGLVMRTKAKAMEKGALAEALNTLRQRWRSLQDSVAKTTAPALVKGEQDPILDILQREMPHLGYIEVETLEHYQAFQRHITQQWPQWQAACGQIAQKWGGFERYGIDAQLEWAMGDVIGLPSGGSIVVEKTAAVVAVDVNTGRSSDARTTNAEAAAMLARIMRLRNLSGQFVVDFVRHKADGKLQHAMQALRQAVAADPRPVHVRGLSPLGLVEFIRERKGAGLEMVLQSPCGECQGEGRQLSDETHGLAALRAVLSEARYHPGQPATLQISPSLAEQFNGKLRTAVEQARQQLAGQLTVQIDKNFPRHRYHVVM
jgi:Rne/Rng family ribonuclease